MIKFLTNQIGEDATTLELLSGSINSSYDITSLIAGPRSRMFRSAQTAGAASTVNIAYSSLGSTTKAADHVVICRADKLLTPGGIKAEIQNKSSGGTWSSILTKDPIQSTDLIGIKTGNQKYGQDFVSEITTTEQHGYGALFTTKTAAESVQLSKLFFCSAFDFGVEPILSPVPQWDYFSEPIFVKPKKATEEIQAHARISLNWQGVTRAKVNEFRALTQILSWPFFLYDPEQTMWPWKLENVVIEDFSETYIEASRWDVSIKFLRIAHYE